jgi:hypothetical protein
MQVCIGDVFMSRYFEPIDVREFKEKIAAHVNDGYIDYRHLTPTVDKDLSKVNFSTENMTDEKYKFGCGLVGYHYYSLFIGLERN